MFAAEEQSGECARVTQSHQGLRGAHLIGRLRHTGHKPPLGAGGFRGHRDVGPTALRGIADHELRPRAFEQCLHLFGGQRHR